MSNVQRLKIPHFVTHSGAQYPNFQVYFQHFGQDYLTAPVVLVNHSLTGDTQVTGTKGWWSEIIGKGLTIDTDYFAVMAFNIPGNGVEDNCIENPEDFHAGDVAEIFYASLQLLGIKKLFAIIGGSIGGGIAWEIAARYPKLTDYLIPIAADWKASDWILANTFLQKRILKHSSEPLKDARIHAMLTYRNPKSLSYRFDRTVHEDTGLFNVESWLLHHGNKLVNRFKLDAYKMMNHLLATIDIGRGGRNVKTLIAAIQSEIHLVCIDSDIFFTPDEDRKTYEMIKPVKSDIFYHEIHSIHGHDAFLIEHQSIAGILDTIFSLTSKTI